MASRRVKYKRTKAQTQSGDEIEYASFIADLLSGGVTATRLYEGRANGRPDFEYDDPTGNGQGQGQGGK